MTILEEIGVDFLHPRARDLLKAAGMKVEEDRVRFDRGWVLGMVAKAPETFELQARNPKRSVTIGGDNMVNAPVYGPPFITDLERGRRGATIEDFNNFDKLAQAVEQIHCAGGTTVEPEDLPLSTRHLDMVYSHLRWTDKPFMGSVIAAENARVRAGNPGQRADGPALPLAVPRRWRPHIVQGTRRTGRLRVDDVHVADSPRPRQFRAARSRLAGERATRVL